MPYLRAKAGNASARAAAASTTIAAAVRRVFIWNAPRSAEGLVEDPTDRTRRVDARAGILGCFDPTNRDRMTLGEASAAALRRS